MQAEFDDIAAGAGLWDKLLAIEELEEQQAQLATNRQAPCTLPTVLWTLQTSQAALSHSEGLYRRPHESVLSLQDRTGRCGSQLPSPSQEAGARGTPGCSETGVQQLKQPTLTTQQPEQGMDISKGVCNRPAVTDSRALDPTFPDYQKLLCKRKMLCRQQRSATRLRRPETSSRHLSARPLARTRPFPRPCSRFSISCLHPKP